MKKTRILGFVFGLAALTGAGRASASDMLSAQTIDAFNDLSRMVSKNPEPQSENKFDIGPALTYAVLVLAGGACATAGYLTGAFVQRRAQEQEDDMDFPEAARRAPRYKKNQPN